MQKIYMVRHGTTEWMEIQKIQGSSNSPLSPQGRLEAQKTAQTLAQVKFDAVYCSPLGRTRETAAIICQPGGYQPKIIEDLREMDFGWLEGSADLRIPSGKLDIVVNARWLARIMVIGISGEGFTRVEKRAKKCWEDINRRSPAGTLLIVAHGIILHYLIANLLNAEQRKNNKRIHLQPCSISEIVLEDDGSAGIVRMNDTSHLK